MKKLVVIAIAVAALFPSASAASADSSCVPKRGYLEETLCTSEGSVEIEEAGARAILSFRDCGPARIELGKKLYRTEDTCEAEWSEPRRSGVLWFFQTPKWFSDHYRVSIEIFEDDSNLEKTIPMRIHYGDGVIRRWALAYVSIHGAKKIWEGTDAFVNVCINDSLEIRSSNGRLYCKTRGWTFKELSIERRKP
jgi:hypothetical protein